LKVARKEVIVCRGMVILVGSFDGRSNRRMEWSTGLRCSRS
jgi:hypothetical protein